MIWSRSPDTIITDNPESGYETTISLNIRVLEKQTGKVETISGRQNRDKYETILKISMPKNKANDFFDLLTERISNIITISDYEGFYPFSPAVSNSSVKIQIKNVTIYGTKQTFFGEYIIFEITIVPDEALTFFETVTVQKEGNFNFAGVGDLGMPLMDYDRKYNESVINLGYKNYTSLIDSTAETSKTVLTCENYCAGNIAEIIKKIVATYRHLKIPVTTGNNYYIFGIDGGALYDGFVKIGEEPIKIKHVNANLFDLEMGVYRE